MNILETEPLQKSFGGIKAVDGFALTVEKGHIHGLIGPNGSGKTTLVHMISGLYPIDGGKIFFEGQEISGQPLHQLARMGIARTFQNLEICQQLTVLENVLLGFSLFLDESFWKSFFFSKKIVTQEQEFLEKAHQLIKEFELTQYRHSPAGQLSYGNQKKLEIARAIAAQPKLLMLDEPVAGVSPGERDEIMKLIKNLNCRSHQPVTILLIEHNMKMVMELSDRISVINFGMKLAEGSPEEVQNHPDVVEAYLGAGAI